MSAEISQIECGIEFERPDLQISFRVAREVERASLQAG